ncbi:bacteriohemerythrin [Quatrionicoccus australiensis]|uniref:bacteriohemerythrin n=1 Tax=Quatrionicoccus australiensis TaxID=138118 RepID=UPI001CF82B14|nr:bacteriohemerythrin [Quatrionicoccus australiensis]UCV16010.1 bacteriohemerythrin [Quatrionicoccus australiensis]
MDIFVWNESFVTGEPVVDAEHQGLVSLVNWLIEHQTTSTPAEEIDKVLVQLVDYAVTHFQHEEELMQSSGCDPRFAEIHHNVHADFGRQVVKMREMPAGDQEFLLRFLSSWLAHHILGMDQSMARQIRKIRAGVSATQAFEEEKDKVADPAMTSLLAGMNTMFRLIAARNDELQQANATLEAQVAARTEALSQSNEQLLLEQARLQHAMQQVEITQKKLLESEHKRAEAAKRSMAQLLSQIIDGDPVPTFVIDASHRITHWNKACAAISSLPAADMVGTSEHWKAFYPERRPLMADLIVDGGFDEQFISYYQNGFRRSAVVAGAFEGEAFFPSLGEQGRWLFFTAAPLYNAEGQSIGAIETLQDVTERHRAEENLLQYQNHLEELVVERTKQLATANGALEKDRQELEMLLSKIEEAQQQLLQSEKMAAIGQLAAGVAHEINNPVGFVNSNLGTLKTYVDSLFAVIDAYQAVDAGADRKMLEAAQQKADLEFLREDLPSLLLESQDGLNRVTKIVQDLKDFSRVDQAARQLANLNEALESTLNVVWNEIKYKAEVVRELGEIPEIECVPAQINQVFMNLLVNAAQAIEQRGSITLRSGLENGYVWFEFADTGKGMNAETAKRIFEPFFTTKPIGQGTGLGLSISYDIIVKKHGGRIDVSSEPGQGTTFRLWLPQRMPAEIVA